MIKKNRVIIFLLSAILLFSTILTGCSQSNTQDLTAEEGYVIVTDYLGKQVKVKQNPDYIGSLFAITTHIAAMFGDAEKVVTMADGNTRDYLFMEMYPQLKNARIVKGGGGVVNIEEVVKQPRPEVLFADTGVTLDDVTMKKLNKLGIPVITIGFDNVEQQYAMMELMAGITGHQEEAAAYIEYCRSVYNQVTSRTATIPEGERKTVYHAINELLRTDMPDTLSANALELAGVKNVGLLGKSSEQDKGQIKSNVNKSYLALEELLKANPEYILINGGDVLDYIESSPQLHNLRAYREGHIYLLPLGVSRWGHPNSIETPLGVLWIAKTVYPELFSDVDIEKETKEFYSRFFDYELSDTQLANILGGRVYKEIKGSGESGS